MELSNAPVTSLHLDEQRGWRGGEQQASYLVQGLCRRGHRVILAGRKGAPFLEHEHGGCSLERIAVPFAGEFDLVTAWKLARVVRREKVDILHAHTSHTHTVACLARFLACRGRVIVSRRVDFPPKRNLVSRWKYRWPDHYIAISERIADVLREAGLPAEKITTVHSGQDPARLDVPPISREALGVAPDAPLLVCAAALVGHKDHATLIAAMPEVVRRFPRVRLLLAGEGELRSAIEAQIRQLGLEEHVRLLGFRKDILRILRAADVFVLSSKMEGLGSVVYEAMGCGLPVVACAGGGIPESITHEQTGLLVPVGDATALGNALVRVLSDPVLARRLARAGKDFFLANRTAEHMVKGNLAVYEKVLRQTR